MGRQCVNVALGAEENWVKTVREDRQRKMGS